MTRPLSNNAIPHCSEFIPGEKKKKKEEITSASITEIRKCNDCFSETGSAGYAVSGVIIANSQEMVNRPVHSFRSVLTSASRGTLVTRCTRITRRSAVSGREPVWPSGKALGW